MNASRLFHKQMRSTSVLIFSCLVLFVGFFYSRFLLSIGQILFCVTALWHYLEHGNSNISRKMAILSLTVLFLAPLLSFWYTGHWDAWLERLRIRLPYLILPIAFVFLPALTEQEQRRVGALFLLVASSACLYVSYLYAIDPTGIQHAIEIGGHFPLLVNHIRFSLILGIAVLYGIYLMRMPQSRSMQWLIFFMTLLCFLTMHLLAVRSGLLAMYCGLVFWWLHLVLVQREWRWLLTLPLSLILLAGAWYVLPSFQTKLGYSYWELMEFLGQSEQATTLSARMQSYFCGWQVFLEQPWWGTGVGDLQTEMARCWVMNFGYESIYMPHNQYLSWLAGNGLIFTLAMLGVCLLPLLGMRKASIPLVWSVILAIMVSFLVENTIENSFGVAIHSFFSLWFLRFHSQKS